MQSQGRYWEAFVIAGSQCSMLFTQLYARVHYAIYERS